MAATRKRFLILSYFTGFICFVCAEDCNIGSYNLTDLHIFSPWTALNEVTNATLSISLCGKLSLDASLNAENCLDGTAVCATFPNGTTVAYGNYTDSPVITEGDDDAELILRFMGQKCAMDRDEMYATLFYFRCGKTLGHPVFLGITSCAVIFEWESYVFCKNLPVPEKEVPCSVVKDGKIIDLSPLTKLTGGHLVDEVNDQKIYINICRDLKPDMASDDATKDCPKGAASCQIISGVGRSFGEPTTKLEATGDGAKLVYSGSDTPHGCVDPATTTIHFRCPERGGSKDPVLLTDFLVTCSMQIEWVTEYACPTDHISSKTCQLTDEQHDIDIDLRPLSHVKYHPYVVNVEDGDDHYVYYINICDSLGSQCGSARTGRSSVCQRKSSNSTYSRNAGENDFHELRYSDRQLTMILRHGDACSSHFRRSSVIDFMCNETAGNGSPEFVRQDNCTYFFIWPTQYACVEEKMDGTCRVETDGKRYDLSALVKEDGTNWEVLTGDDEDGFTYFVNVCHDVLDAGDASTCPPGAAVCAKGPKGAFSLGHYTQALAYDKASNSLRLLYTDGDETANKCKRKTSISFYCSPGDLESAPVLVHKSPDGCSYELEWHTAAACVLSHAKGTNCRVVDNDAGYVFDLNPLKLTKNGTSYAVKGKDNYNYMINVCAPINDKNYCNEPPHDNAAICQVELGIEHRMKKIGEPVSELEYFDGVLNLTYTNGENYNDDHHTPRMAEIAFLCDMTAGSGHPEFLEEKDFTYAFLWRTQYACPTPPVECVATDTETHEQYDLSSLAKVTENWSVMRGQSDPTQRQKFYINVCRPLASVPGVQCGRFASVCATNVDKDGNESLFHGSLGKSESSPVVEKVVQKSSSGVKLVYTNGDDCMLDGVKQKFKTTIHFVCQKGKVTGGPIAPQLVNDCEYTILWETAMACPVDDVQTPGVTPCMVHDPNTDFSFNLMPLSKPDGYNVTDKEGSKSYTLNICGGLSDSVCGKMEGKDPTSVCETTGMSGRTPKARSNTQLDYSGKGEITLTYDGQLIESAGVVMKYTLNFFCDRTAQDPVVTFESQTRFSTTFHVSTALACAPQPVDCVVQDAEGKQYDLRPLARQSGNWIVVDTRATHSDLQYYINVCRPVNMVPGLNCPGGAVGACQSSQSSDSAFNLGYVQSQPVVASKGEAITIRYVGGDKCHKGTEKEAFRSTRITLFCDHVMHNPVFQSESDTCEYNFVWQTPSACPQQVARGSNCMVSDPLYNFQFDFSSLRNSSGDYKVQGRDYEFLINICGSLVNAPVGCEDKEVGACQTGSTLSSPIAIGKYNNNPVYDSGQISMEYSEGKASCHSKFTRSTIINFVCDPDQSGLAGPRYLQEESDCTYIFEWPTKQACPPHQVSDCTYRHGDDTFDLSPLTLVDKNYERAYPNSNTMYIVNICRSLVHTKGQTCPFDAAACMIDLSATDPKERYHNIGEVTSHSISYKHNTLMLRYENGELCEDGKTKTATVILFQCDQTTDALGTPNGHFRVNCEDHFTWTSSAACPLAKGTDSSDVQSGFGNCQVKNPNTGYEFDLTSLRKTDGYTTYDREGHEFTLNVCAWLDKSSPCQNGTGACETERLGNKNSVSMGAANARLLYRDGILALEYTGGQTCQDTKATRTTIINFVCLKGAGEGVPVFIDKSDDCDYYFDWRTDLACETQLSCEVQTDTGHTLDFSPLIKISGKYNVLPNGVGGHHSPGMVYLNLCRPLNPILGALCPAGSGACLVQGEQKPLSLGRVNQPLTYDKDSKEVRVTYDHGDPCPLNPKVNLSSTIILKCGDVEFLDPEMEPSNDDCQYLFLWETPLACAGRTSQKMSSNCSFYDRTEQVTYDLSSLTDEVQLRSSHGGNFHIKPCGHLTQKGETQCGQSSVCLSGSDNKDGSYGTSDSGVFRKNSFTVDLQYSHGRKCGTGGSSQAMSTIYFKCERSAGQGLPRLVDDEECEATFLWPTSLVCPPERKECTVSDRTQLFDLSFLSQDTGSWNYTDTHSNTYWLNLCQPVHGRALAAGCPREAAVCMKSKDGKVHTLGRLDTQVTRVEKDAVGSSSTIVVEYAEGDPDLCTIGRRRRSGQSPKVIVRLKCGKLVGSPVFREHRPEQVAKCIFEFTWETRLACPSELMPTEVKEIDGQVKEERTNKVIDLTPLIEPELTHTQVVGTKKYFINLGASLKVSTTPTACDGAAVCQQTIASNTFRNLGSFTSRTYYMHDERLEVVFTSPEVCPGKQNKLNITSTIIFNCLRGSALTDPEYLYQSSECSYIFNWDTSIVCLHANPSVVKPTDTSDSDHDDKSASSPNDDSGVGASKIAIGVAIFLSISLVCVMILVLHKPERRAAVGARLKRILLCRKVEDSPITYSRLSQADGLDNDLDDDPFNPFNEPDDEAEINNSQLPPRVHTFHDDSDEDMLL